MWSAIKAYGKAVFMNKAIGKAREHFIREFRTFRSFYMAIMTSQIQKAKCFDKEIKFLNTAPHRLRVNVHWAQLTQ